MNTNKANPTPSDNYITERTQSLNGRWTLEEQNVLQKAADFVRRSDDLRAHFLITAIRHNSMDTTTVEHKIQYWKNIADGKVGSDAQENYGLSATMPLAKRAEAKSIIEEYRSLHAQGILQKIEGNHWDSSPALSPERAAIISSINKTYDDIVVEDEDSIRATVQNTDGPALANYYRKNLMPFYRSTLDEMTKRFQMKPANMSEERFRAENEVFANHAQFLKEQINIVRAKVPDIDAAAKAFQSIAKPAKTDDNDEAPHEHIIPLQTAAQDPQSLTNRITSSIGTLGRSVSSFLKRVIGTITPSPKIGWGMIGSAAVASVALAATLHSGEVDNSEINNIPHAKTTSTQGIGKQAVSGPISVLSTLPAAIAAPAEEPKIAAALAIETIKPLKIAMVHTTVAPKTAPLAPSTPERAATASVSDAFNSQQAEGRPVTEEPFDIATFRPDLTTLSKACKAAGVRDADSVCGGLKGLANE